MGTANFIFVQFSLNPHVCFVKSFKSDRWWSVVNKTLKRTLRSTKSVLRAVDNSGVINNVVWQTLKSVLFFFFLK